MATPSELNYDLLCRFVEEGRDKVWLPPPAAAVPTPPPEALLEPPPKLRGRTIPAWASAMRGFSNALCLLLLTFFAVPLGMHYKNRDEAFICIFLVIMSFSFPVMGYVVTWEFPDEEAVKGRSSKLQQSTQVRFIIQPVVTTQDS